MGILIFMRDYCYEDNPSLFINFFMINEKLRIRKLTYELTTVY